MKSKLVLLIIPLMFFACEEATDEKAAIDCNALMTTLSEHTYLEDLESFMSTSEYPGTYLTNCNAYYEELQSLVDEGCYDTQGWTADSVTAMKNEMCDTTSAEVESIIGTWAASLSEYNSPDCDADSLEFSATGTATYGETTLLAEYTFSIGTFEDFCTEVGGTMDGDSCTVSAYGYSMSIDESYFADSLCIPEGGTIDSDGACVITGMDTLDYTIDGTDYCETIDAGTDSSETDCGTIDLSATSATITFSDDSTCTVYELSK